jgi:DNA-binding GntR family transcriptional regulator
VTAGAADPKRARRPLSDGLTFENLKNGAGDFIRAAIVSGELPAGSKIDQDAIADALGISRAPVREALIELAQKGFVVHVPRRGAFVAELTVADIEDYYEVVASVFAMMTRRAVAKLTSADLGELRRLHREIAATDDAARCEELDRRFFNVIVTTGRSSRLDSLLRFIGGMFQGSFYFASPGWAQNEAGFRQRLLEAIEAADERAAARISEEHLHSCAGLTVEHLRASGYWGSR